ncbi:TIR domain-containing protein [Luteolibacter arcticus]|uniref:TIR domain-containing protein n=1 Tax=Luteolibacter arcticus TaxID=1581411 RepID=A0ABT3GQC2_9BACT|nr:PQQ-binding-like beta-propeller repeat protein [Luteolibacter arcticus]MCW1925676.1 TIR domain-containing protein [Luteolibacter arcticus]
MGKTGLGVHRWLSFPAEKMHQKFRAFISYRHDDNRGTGRNWAEWLQKELEDFQIPHELRGRADASGQPVPDSLFPVFRDVADLAASSSLPKSIQDGLFQSACLIVVCTDGIKDSIHVAEEIRFFKKIGRADRIFLLRVAGEGGVADFESLPDSLRLGDVDCTGSLDWSLPFSPLAADIAVDETGKEGWTTVSAHVASLRSEGFTAREAKLQARRYAAKLQAAKWKLAAAILKVDPYELTRRLQERELAAARRATRVFRRWLAAVGVFALLASVFGFMAWRQTDAERSQRERGDLLLQKASDNELAISAQELDANHWQVAMARARQALELRGDNLPAAQWVESLLIDHTPFRTIGVLDVEVAGGLECEESMCFSPDGTTIYVAGAYGASKSHAVRAYSTESGRQLWSTAVAGEPGSLCRLHDGRALSLAVEEGETGSLLILDAATGERLHTLPEKVLALAASPVAPLLALAVPVDKYKAELQIVDLATMSTRNAPLQSHTDRITGMRLSPDGRTAAIFGSYLLETIDISSGGQKGKTFFAGGLWDLQFSRDSARMAVSGRELAGAVVSVADGSKLWDLDLKEKGDRIHNFRRIVYSPEGGKVASCGGSQFVGAGDPETMIRIFNAESGELMGHIATDHVGEALAISEDGSILAYGDGESMSLVDLDRGRKIDTVEFANSPASIAFAPGNRCMAVACYPAGLYLLEMATSLHAFQSKPGQVDENASRSGERSVQWGGLADRRRPGNPANLAIAAVALHRGTGRLAYGGDDKRLCCADFPSGNLIWSRDFEESIHHAMYSEDGKVLAFTVKGGSTGDHLLEGMENILIKGSSSLYLNLVDADTGCHRWSQQLRFEGKRDAFAVKPLFLNQVVAVAGAGAWRIDTGAPDPAASAFFKKLDTVAIGRDGKLLARTAGTVQLLKWPSLEPLFSFEGIESSKFTAWSVEGSRLYSCSGGMVRALPAGSSGSGWEGRFDEEIIFLAECPGDICLVGSNGKLWALEGASGEEIWRKDLDEIIDLRVVAESGVIIACGGPHSYGLDIRSGREMFRRNHADKLLLSSEDSDGYNYVVGRFGIACDVVENSRFDRPVPSWFSNQLLQSQGWHTVRSGLAELDTPSQTSAALEVLRNEYSLLPLAASTGQSDAYGRMLGWLFRAREDRSVSPSSSVKLVDVAEQLFQSSEETKVWNAYHAAPWHPLAGFGLASISENDGRATWLREWGLSRLAAADAKAYDESTRARHFGLAAAMALEAKDTAIARKIIATSEAESLVHADIFLAKARLLTDAGEKQAARDSLIRAHELVEKDDHSAPAKAREIRTALVKALVEDNRSPEARDILRQHLAECRTKPGLLAEDIMETLQPLCNLLIAEGKPDEALGEIDRVLPVVQRFDGTVSKLEIMVLCLREALLTECNRLEDAFKQAKESFRLIQQLHGSDSREACDFASQIAGKYFRNKQYKEAADQLRFVVDARKKNLLPKNPLTLRSMHELSIVLRAGGERAEGLALLKETRDLATKYLGAEHDLTGRITKDLESEEEPPE